MTRFTWCGSPPSPSTRGREVWRDLRQLPDQESAHRFKGARWALLKNPADLTDDQALTLRKLKRRGGDLWRSYALKEALRAIFAGDLDEDEVAMMLDRFCSRASRSGLKPFVIAAQTIRKRKTGILAAIRLGVNNARHEGLNRRVRLIINRAHGFHSANAALALIMVTLGPITHVLRQRACPGLRCLNQPTSMPGGPDFVHQSRGLRRSDVLPR